MVEHCVGTPVGGYLGSDYGVDLKALLQTPMASGLADDLIAKIRADVPLLTQAPPGAINVYSQQIDIDQMAILLEVAGQSIDLGTSTTP